MQMSHKNHEFASNDGFLNSCSFSFSIKIFLANKLNKSINEIINSPDINPDVYEIIKRTGGKMSPSVTSVFSISIFQNK